MSAYIVNREVIVYLIHAAMSQSIVSSGPLYWHHTDYASGGNKLGNTDWAQAAEVGNMLWMENVASVSARYPRESSATLPGPTDRSDFLITVRDLTHASFDHIDPVQVLKTCNHYEYQSCEHTGWKASEACAFIGALRAAAIHSLPGYGKAAWGAPRPQAQLGGVWVLGNQMD